MSEWKVLVTASNTGTGERSWRRLIKCVKLLYCIGFAFAQFSYVAFSPAWPVRKKKTFCVFNQSEAELQLIVTCFCVLSRALPALDISVRVQRFRSSNLPWIKFFDVFSSQHQKTVKWPEMQKRVWRSRNVRRDFQLRKNGIIYNKCNNL